MTHTRTHLLRLCWWGVMLVAPFAVPAQTTAEPTRERSAHTPSITSVKPNLTSAVAATHFSAPIGQVTQTGEPLWGGELIQAPAGQSLHVQLPNAGAVTLARGSAARFATAQSRTDGPVLIATLERGAFKVTLAATASAYLEAGDEVFQSTPGASFRLAWRESEILAEVDTGTLWQRPPKGQLQFKTGDITRGGGFLPNPKDTDTVKKKTRTETTLAFQGTLKPASTAPRRNQTTLKLADGSADVFRLQTAAFVPATAAPLWGESAEPQTIPLPAAGFEVLLEVDAKLGCLVDAAGLCGPSANVRTDQQGVVRVVFRATSTRQSGQLRLTVNETPTTERYTRAWTLNVEPVFLTKPVKIMLGAAAAAALGFTIREVIKEDDGLKPLPPPSIVR